jgi:hypothetical protein
MNLTLCLVLFVFIESAFCDTINYPVGVYFTFKEYTDKNPKIGIDTTRIDNPYQKKMCIYDQRGKLYYYNTEKKEYQRIKGDIWGYNTGIEFYITYGGYRLLEILPYYSLFYMEVAETPGGCAPYIRASEGKLDAYVINMQTGEISRLDKDLVSEILKDDTELLKKYSEMDDNKDQSALPYLRKYIQRKCNAK